jgi:hypothetical protein
VIVQHVPALLYLGDEGSGADLKKTYCRYFEETIASDLLTFFETYSYTL